MRKKLLSGFLIAGMLLSPMTFMEVEAKGSSIVIYHTNDTHGYMGSGNAVSYTHLDVYKRQRLY